MNRPSLVALGILSASGIVGVFAAMVWFYINFPAYRPHATAWGLAGVMLTLTISAVYIRVLRRNLP